MRIEGNFNVFTRFYSSLISAMSNTATGRELFKAAALEHTRLLNIQIEARARDLAGGLYPPPRGKRRLPKKFKWAKNGKLSAFKSLKQQRLVFALLARGAIPYRRTGRLADATRIRSFRATQDGYTLIVNVDLVKAPYANLVIGHQQTDDHKKTGWRQLSAFHVIERYGQTAARPYLDQLEGHILGSA